MKYRINYLKRINLKFVWFGIIAWLAVNLILSSCLSVPKKDYTVLGKPDDPVPFNTSVITGHLPNGLRYFILENSLPENRAHLGLIVNAGSVLERDDQRGFAHFIEHLAFSDTKRFPDLQIQEYLRSLGMRFGPDFNAYTSHDQTVYYFDVPVENESGIKKIPIRALEILDDWTHNVSFKEEFVESEKRVIIEEMRARSGAQERIRKILYPLLFAGSAYENRDVIGLEETIENSSSETLKEFYDAWYTSANMAVVFIGDFNGKELEKELKNKFTMPKTARGFNRPVFKLPPPKNGNFQTVIITDPEITSTGFSVYLKQSHTEKKGTIASYRESVIDYLISYMLNQRFEEAHINPESAAIDSYAGPWYWSGNAKFFLMGTTPKTGRAEDAILELLTEKESMKRGFGFTENELYRAKLNLISYMEKQLSEKNRRESRTFLRFFTSHFLYGEDFADIEWERDFINKILPGISLEEIAKAAAACFSDNDIIAVLTAPEAEKENLPSEEQIKEIFLNAEKIQITQRQDEAFSDELVELLPARGKIINEEIDKDTQAVILELSNGAKIILKETLNRNNEIIMYALSKGGTVNADEDASVSVNLLSEMVQVSGLGPFSRTELIQRLSGKQVSFSFWVSGYYRGLQAASTTQDLKTLFEMLHLFFTNPKLDKRAIASMIEQYKTQLMHQMEDPQRFFFNEVTKTITNNHPRLKPLELADLDEVSIEKAERFLLNCVNPEDYTIVFTGNIDINAVKELALIYLASIQNNNNNLNTIIDPKITRPDNIKKIINKGSDDRSMVFLGWYTTGDNNFNERKNQISSVFSEYLDILLNDEIREKLGGVYGISSGASVSVIPKGENSLSVYFVCAPQRAEELSAAVISSLENIIKQGLNTDTFNKAKEALLMQHQRSVQSNLHISQSYANSSALYNTPLSRLDNRPEVIRTITESEVLEFCREVLNTNPVQVMLYPENYN